MIYKGGYNTYGQVIGVLVLETTFPRIPGDIGNATSFDFPVRFRTVKGATSKRVVEEQDPKLLCNFIEAAQELVREGVQAITTTCGFLAIFQKEINAAVEVPVFTSSLLQIPIVYRMLQSDKKVGVITSNARSLHKGILEAVGAADVPVIIGGMEDQHEFTYVRKEMNRLDPKKVRAEVVSVARKLVIREPRLGAIVLECTNLPPYSKAVRDATGLPVFDIMTLTKWVYSALIQQKYEGYM